MGLPSFLDQSLEQLRERLGGEGLAGAGAMLPELAFRGVHQGGARSFGALTGVGHRKVAVLDRVYDLRVPAIAATHGSWDQSVRYAFRLDDGAIVETVLIPHHGLWTACLSSQAGCALACTFCATGKLGLTRNLTAGEIVAQVLEVARHSGRRVSDLVFMGMGEPLQNEAAVFKACRILNAAEGAQISLRRMVISTAGVVPAIHRFAQAGHRMNLVFSLASAVPEKRALLMPIQALHGFDEFLDAIRAYAETRRGKYVTLEYLAIRNLTLGDDDVLAIRKYLTGFRFILNVIPLNPVDPSLESPTLEEVREFTDKLRPLGFPVKIRRSSGRDQQGGCGQLGATLLGRGGVTGRSLVEGAGAPR